MFNWMEAGYSSDSRIAGERNSPLPNSSLVSRVHKIDFHIFPCLILI